MNPEDLNHLVDREESQAGTHSGVDNLVIIGGGTMGQGISVAASRRGVEVLLVERNQESLDRSLKKLNDRLDHEIARWALTESEKNAILSRIQGTISLDDIGEQEYILEAIPESLELKQQLFKALDEKCVPEAILITNTSTLSITELASVTQRPDRVIGMHFLNPVPKVKVIELVRGLKTSRETYHKATLLAEKLERTSVEVFESPGYVTTRVMMPLVNEAIHVLMEGVAAAEGIDTALKLGYELPMGPLEMADRIGLDLVLSWMENLFRELGDTKYRPCPMLRILVRAGHLGVKTNRGFFRYDDEGRVIPGSGHRAASDNRLL